MKINLNSVLNLWAMRMRGDEAERASEERPAPAPVREFGPKPKGFSFYEELPLPELRKIFNGKNIKGDK